MSAIIAPRGGFLNGGPLPEHVLQHITFLLLFVGTAGVFC